MLENKSKWDTNSCYQQSRIILKRKKLFKFYVLSWDMCPHPLLTVTRIYRNLNNINNNNINMSKAQLVSEKLHRKQIQNWKEMKIILLIRTGQTNGPFVFRAQKKKSCQTNAGPLGSLGRRTKVLFWFWLWLWLWCLTIKLCKCSEPALSEIKSFFSSFIFNCLNLLHAKRAVERERANSRENRKITADSHA